jgi:hypothetical protein
MKAKRGPGGVWKQLGRLGGLNTKYEPTNFFNQNVETWR